jgi:predicted amidophosphoribosyltransferase
LLARPLARRLGATVAPALERRRRTETQASLSLLRAPGQRRTCAFALRRGADVRGKRILLVDAW